MARLAVHVNFLSEFTKLEKSVQKAVKKALVMFQENTHTGLHLEKIAGGLDSRIRTIRITDYWRGVVVAPEKGDVHTLLRVDGHDEATTWARQHLVSVNTVSGALQITNVEELERLVPTYQKEADQADTLLFDRVRDAQLARLGIDDRVRAAARLIGTLDQLRTLEPLIPESQYTTLFLLGSGFSPDDVWAQHVAPLVPAEDVDVDDVAAAAVRSQGRVALVDGPDALLALFDRPLALWRVFLHPAQETVAYRPSYSGSAKVSGGPGTGKTVAALHRVKHLIETRDLPPGSVLLTTFTKGLAAALERDLTQLVPDPIQRLAVQVVNVDKYAHDLVSERHGKPHYFSPAEYRKVWETAAARTGGQFTPAFLNREWEAVVFGQDVSDLDGYLAADRRGRGRRLSTEQKRQAWAAFAEANRVLRAGGRWTSLTVAAEAARLLAERPEPPFRHVVVDEVQDLHPTQWRLLRALVAPGPDDLFLTGDPHQRIYGHRVNLKALGIHVTGRSTTLHINYRTTAEILAWAMRVLADTDSDDLDGGIDSLLGYRSALHGAPPDLVGTTTAAEEGAALAEAVRGWRAEGVDWSEIGVAARTGWVAGAVRHALTEAGVPAVTMSDPHDEDAVVVGTMHGMKGLEFRCVALVGVTAGAVPDPRALTPADEDPLGHALDLQQERSLLFVAATRARERLRVSWWGAPSLLLPRA